MLGSDHTCVTFKHNKLYYYSKSGVNLMFGKFV